MWIKRKLETYLSLSLHNLYYVGEIVLVQWHLTSVSLLPNSEIRTNKRMSVRSKLNTGVINSSSRNYLAQEFAKQMQNFARMKDEMSKKMDYMQDNVTNIILDANEVTLRSNPEASHDSNVTLNRAHIASPNEFSSSERHAGKLQSDSASENTWTTVLPRSAKRNR